MDLLKKLPGMERYDSVGFSDLRYLMKLVYTNRKRVKFLRWVFHSQAVVLVPELAEFDVYPLK